MQQDHKKYLDQPVTMQELLDVLKTVKMNKVPGPDGYGVEFYKIFKAVLLKLLQVLRNHILQGGTLPSTWSDAYIMLIPKDQTDLVNPSPYSPISLLNTDMNIFTKILANRLKAIIPQYIGQDQTGE